MTWAAVGYPDIVDAQCFYCVKMQLAKFYSVFLSFWKSLPHICTLVVLAVSKIWGTLGKVINLSVPWFSHVESTMYQAEIFLKVYYI